MLIEIHVIQNYGPSNLNRDKQGVPKSCMFGDSVRSRISSQCIKRSIRTSEPFAKLKGGIRTRQLAKLITEQMTEQGYDTKRAEKILALVGLKPKEQKSKKKEEQPIEDDASKSTKMLVYTTKDAIAEMANLLQTGHGNSDIELARKLAEIICNRVAVPDIALQGRMLEPSSSKGGKADDPWNGLNTTVEAALQVGHAISTHESVAEVDYFVAVDDVPGEDAGAAYLDEGSLFNSPCFYKYFSINWEKLVGNLAGQAELAAHTVGAYLNAIGQTNPSGKQNSYAANNRPNGILVEIRDSAPMSYVNAFVDPVTKGRTDIVTESINRLGSYVYDDQVGYGEPLHRFWFSPNMRYPLKANGNNLTENNLLALDKLVAETVRAIGYDWGEVQSETVA